MSPFLFVSFVTRRSACKVEYNILLSLSSQVSTLSFRRKRGHCALNSHNLQPKFTITLSWAFLCDKIPPLPAFVKEPAQSMGHPTTPRGGVANDLGRWLLTLSLGETAQKLLQHQMCPRSLATSQSTRAPESEPLHP